MRYNIYIDESGNTGEPQIKNGIWNYGAQPYFALGSITMAEEVDKELNNSILMLFQKYDAKLGKENELKGKNDYYFKEELLRDLIDLIKRFSCFTYFDISNKRYKVFCYIVDYCVYPYYLERRLINPEEYRIKRINAACKLYYGMNESLVEKYSNLVRDKELTKEQLVEFLEELQIEQKRKKQKEIIEGIAATIEFIKTHPDIPIKNLIPIEDYTNKGKALFFLPNIDALNNIVSQIGILRLNSDDSIKMIHDEQAQFSNSIVKWVSFQKVRGVNVSLRAFEDSKKSAILQTTDFLSGTIMRLFRKIIDGKPLTRDDRDIAKILNPLLSDDYSVCNVVSVNSEIKCFFDGLGMKTISTTVPHF